MGYDISADYVDSTTTYEPRSTIIDSDFIGGHSKCDNFIKFLGGAMWGDEGRSEMRSCTATCLKLS
jgi:hypothetical protein